jgi:hypothetical protein
MAPIAVVTIAGVAQTTGLAATHGAAGVARPADRVLSDAARVPHGSLLLGRDPGSTPLTLDVALVPRSPTALASFVAGVSTPGTPAFRHFLAPGQFAARFGPSSATLENVTAALRRLGLVRLRLTANHLLVTVHTTVATAEKAMSTTIERFRLRTGRDAYANVADAKLPGSVAPDVQGVFGLSDVVGLQPTGRAMPAVEHAGTHRRAASVGRRGTGPAPCTSATGTGAATANVLAAAYGIAGLYRRGDLGQGQTIALFEPAAYSAADVAVYQRCYKTGTSVAITRVDGGTSVGSGTLEATSDVEDLIGLAPHARVRVYETSNYFTPNWLDQWAAIVDSDTANVVSTSWLSCEPFLPTGFAGAEATEFEQAAAQGQTVVAATGDYGSESCDQFDSSHQLSVDDPASDPYVTAVGGTTWTSTAPRSGERTWNDPSTGSSGGGISSIWPMPSWQQGRGVSNRHASGVPCGAVTGDCRESPDVTALAGAPFYAFFCNAGDCSNIDGWGRFYGTSFATPLWAASVALTDESCASEPPVGFLDPALYAVASTPFGGLFDITKGDTDFTGSHHGDYPATAGYDLATGLGTPEWTTGTAVMGLSGLLCELPKLPPVHQTVKVAPPSGSAVDPGAVMNAVACTSLAHCAAVGTFTDGSARTQAMAVSEVGGAWRTSSEVAAPLNAAANPGAALDGLACTAAGSCVGAGTYTDGAGDAEAMVSRESAGAWGRAVEVSAPTTAAGDPLATLKGVACTSAGNCVAVGSYDDVSGHEQAMEATETSGVWAQTVSVTAPSGAGTNPLASLAGVSCTSLGNCMAAGTYTTTPGASKAMAAEESSGTWLQAVGLTAPTNAASNPDAALKGIACTAPGTCVAVGSYANGAGHVEPLEATETGGTWARGSAVAVPSNANVDPSAALGAISCVAAGSCVVVGAYVDDAGAQEAMIASEDGKRWSTATALAAPPGAAADPHASLTGIACPSVASCVGIGGYATAAGDVVTMAGRASLPTVTKLSSDRGSTSGGTPMYVIGANLADVVSVHFGAARARIDGLVVPAELEVTPPRGTGTVFVTVASAWGSSRRTARARYTYVRPRR